MAYRSSYTCCHTLSLPDALPVSLILSVPADAAGRAVSLYWCWLAASVLGAVSVALHHKLCHTLGGTFDMPHAQTHTAVLPHAIAYNAPETPDPLARASSALGGGDPATRPSERRSEERRVGKQCVSTCSSPWSQDPENQQPDRSEINRQK